MAKAAETLLSRVTWALLKWLVCCLYQCKWLPGGLSPK